MTVKEAAIAAAGGSIHEFRKATRKMRWWYESLADYMIAYPNATQNELAAQFNRNPATISTIVNTDAFKAYFRQRRAHHAEKLDEGVRDKLFKVANNSLDHMLDVLNKKRDTVPLEMLARITDSSLKNLGYGVTPPAGVTVNVANQPQHVHVAVSLDDLEAARAALRRNQLATPATLVIENEEPPNAPALRSSSEPSGPDVEAGTPAGQEPGSQSVVSTSSPSAEPS